MNGTNRWKGEPSFGLTSGHGKHIWTCKQIKVKNPWFKVWECCKLEKI